MNSDKLKNKRQELMITLKIWAELNKQELAESVMEHVQEYVVPFAEIIPSLSPPVINRAAVQLAGKGDDTLWVCIQTENGKPDIKFFETNWHMRPANNSNKGPAELKKITLDSAVSKYEDSLKSRLEDNLMSFMDKANEEMKRQIANRPTDEQIKQRKIRLNKNCELIHTKMAEMYRNASIELTGTDPRPTSH